MIFRKRKEKIIFLHIPKAGGTTFRQILYNQYKHLKKDEIYTINRTKETEIFLNLSESKLKKIKLLIGHMPFGLHNYLVGDFKYITFVRNPIERVKSAYNYNRIIKESDVFTEIQKNGKTLNEYLINNIEPWSSNAMTKHLAGCSQSEFIKDCTIKTFKKARKNLLEKFIFVGLTERFDDSLIVLKDLLNWSVPNYRRLNTNKSNNLAFISKQDLDLISKKNKFDLLLYEELKHKFNNYKNSVNNFDSKKRKFLLSQNKI